MTPTADCAPFTLGDRPAQPLDEPLAIYNRRGHSWIPVTLAIRAGDPSTLGVVSACLVYHSSDRPRWQSKGVGNLGRPLAYRVDPGNMESGNRVWQIQPGRPTLLRRTVSSAVELASCLLPCGWAGTPRISALKRNFSSGTRFTTADGGDAPRPTELPLGHALYATALRGWRLTDCSNISRWHSGVVRFHWVL